MENSKSKDRIPFETLGENTAVSAWNLPSVDTGSKLVRSAKRENDKKDPRKNEKIETVKKPKKSKPLTVEELREITETARKEGFQQGLKEGTEQGIREGTKVGEKTGQQRAYIESKKEIEALQNQLRQIANRLFDPMESQGELVENIVVDLALNLSQNIIENEITTKPEVVLNLVKKVLSDLPKGAENIRVSMNESDADIVDNLLPAANRDWSVVRDNSLASGGCTVETNSSLIDFSVEKRFATYLEKTQTADGSESQSQALDPLPDYSASLEDEKNDESEQNAE